MGPTAGHVVCLIGGSDVPSHFRDRCDVLLSASTPGYRAGTLKALGDAIRSGRSAVSGFIRQHPVLLHVHGEAAPPAQGLLELRRAPHEDVDGEGMIDRRADPRGEAQGRLVALDERKFAPYDRSLRSGWKCHVSGSDPAIAPGRLRVNPLAYWSLDRVRSYITENRVPYSVLDERKFASYAPPEHGQRVEQPACVRGLPIEEDVNVAREPGVSMVDDGLAVHDHVADVVLG